MTSKCSRLADPTTLEGENKIAILKANELFSQAKMQTASGPSCVDEHQSVCSLLADCCELYSKVFGESHASCVQPYFEYGVALLQLGRLANQYIQDERVRAQEDGQELLKEEGQHELEEAMEDVGDDNQTTEAEGMEVEESEEQVEAGEEDTEEGNTKGGSEDGDESECNLKLALTMFDAVKKICLSGDPNSDHVKIINADCLLREAEALQELDDFSGALEALQKSLVIQHSTQMPNFRMRAESLYYTGVVFENTTNYPNALQAYEKCLESLNARIAELETQSNDQCSSIEISELRALLQEVNQKIVDVQMSGDENLKRHVAEASHEQPRLGKSIQGAIDLTGHLVKKFTEPATSPGKQ